MRIKQKWKEALALVLGGTLGFGAMVCACQTFFSDEKEKTEDEVKQEQELPVDDSLYVLTSSVSKVDCYLEFNKDSFFLSKDAGFSKSLLYEDICLRSMSYEYETPVFDVVVNNSANDFVDGALNFYDDGEKLCLTKTAYLPLSLDSSSLFPISFEEGNTELTLSYLVEEDALRLFDFETTYLIYIPENESDATYSFKVLKSLT